MSPKTLDPRPRGAVAPQASAPAAPAPRAARPPTPSFVPTPPATRRLSPALFGVTLVACDAAALVLALAAAHWVRFDAGVLPTPLGSPPLRPYLATWPIVVGLGLLVFHEAGLYRAHRRADVRRDILEGTRAVVLLGVLLAAVAFFYREFSFSRTFLALYVGCAAILVVALRRVAGVAHRALRARGIGVQRVALAGGEVADRLARQIAGRPGSGLEVVARLTGEEWRGLDGPGSDGSLRPRRVRALIHAHRVDRLVVTDPSLTHAARLELVEACHEEGCRCDFVPDLFEVMLGRVRVEEIDGVPLVGVTLHPLGRLQRFQKRTLDLVVASLGLLLFAPILLVLAIAVKADSKGPVLFRQRRIGRDGREFDIVKFRSMPAAAERDTGPVRATRDDPRPTRVGRVLRRTSLDELPQLWNVARGEMSLVGPRPERPVFVDEFRQSIPRYLERHGVKSGMTGWAQVHGLRGDTSIDERTRYDIWYVEHWSLSLDVKILVLTALRVLFQEEAY
ncbi:MAG: undecaprenyl-phosphate glucose phosphotransferase [bacterium]